MLGTAVGKLAVEEQGFKFKSKSFAEEERRRNGPRPLRFSVKDGANRVAQDETMKSGVHEFISNSANGAKEDVTLTRVAQPINSS